VTKRHAPPGTALRVPVPRSGDTQGVGVGDRFAQQVNQRVVNARVLDAGGSEKKLHPCLLYVAVLMPSSRVGRRVHGTADCTQQRKSSP